MASACISAAGNGSSYSEHLDERHFGYAIARRRCDVADPAEFLRAVALSVLDPSCLFHGGHGGLNHNGVIPELKHGRDDRQWLRLPPQNTVTLEPKIGRLA